VSKVLITKPIIFARYAAFTKSNASIGFEGRLGLNMSSEADAYQIKSGTNLGVGTYFNYHSQKSDPNFKSLEGRVFYSVDNQDTSLTTRELTNLSFGMFYTWMLPW
jgi:hypothetical protein